MKNRTHDNRTKGPKQGGNRSKTAPDTLDALERQTEALRLRQAGHTFQQIADALGYANRSSAYDAVMAALRETVIQPNNEMRAKELNDLDALQEGLWTAAVGGDQGAVTTCLKIMARRAAILGLDAAPKLPVGDIDQLIEKELERIAGMEASS